MSETKDITYSKCPCGDRACNQYIMSNQGSVGFSLEDAQLFKAAPKMCEALREAERFMAYFAGEEDIFVGPGTPNKCLAQIRQALAEAKGETE